MFSNIMMCQCRIIILSTCPSIFFLHLKQLLQFISLQRRFRTEFLKVPFATSCYLSLSFYSHIYFWFYTHTIDLSGDIEKNLEPRSVFFQDF